MTCFFRIPRLPLQIILALLVSSAVLAQTGAKLEGVVTDSQTGRPIEGVQVNVLGTKLGNVTTTEGYYFILNVPIGNRSVSFTRTGYRGKTVEGIRLSAGHTATLDAQLESTTYELEAITVEAGDNPLVPRDNVQTAQKVDARTIEDIPATTVEDIVALQAGVVTDPYGQFNIRGGRSGRQAVYIDGMLVRSFNERAYEADNTPLAVATNALEEVSVITGGFSSEFGQAASGVVNEITREGASRLTGSVSVISDAMMPEGSDYGYNRLLADVGGPVEPVTGMNFFLSAELLGRGDRSPSSGGFRGIDKDFVNKLNSYLTTLGLYDPSSSASIEGGGALDADSYRDGIQKLDIFSFSNVLFEDTDGDGIGDLRRFTQGDDFSGSDGLLGTQDDKRQLNPAGVYSSGSSAKLVANNDDQYSLSGKLTWYQNENLKWLGSYQTSRKQRRAYTHSNIFNNPERTNLAARIETENLTTGFDWIIEQSSKRNTNLKLRANFYNNHLLVGTPDLSSIDRSSFGNFSFGTLKIINEDRTEADDTYRNIVNSGLENEQREPSGTSSTEESSRGTWPTAVTGANIPFGVTLTELPEVRGNYSQSFINAGLLTNFENSQERRYSVKLDLESQLNRYFRAKTGVDFKTFDIREGDFSQTGGVFQDFYNVEPLIAAAYMQNILDFGDLVLDYGVRVDYMDLNAEFPKVIGEVRPGDDTYSPEPQIFISPRASVAHPVTDRSQIRLSYGHFFQTPSFKDIFSHMNQDYIYDLGGNTNNFFGNGNLEMVQNVMFEMGFTTLLSENTRLDLVGYHTQVKGDIGVRLLTPAQLLDLGGITDQSSTRSNASLGVYTNRDEMNTKGLEITFSKRRTQYWGLNATYTLSFPRATASDPLEYILTFGRQTYFDPITGTRGVQPPPRTQTPIDYDQTHRFNFQVDFSLPRIFEPAHQA